MDNDIGSSIIITFQWLDLSDHVANLSSNVHEIALPISITKHLSIFAIDEGASMPITNYDCNMLIYCVDPSPDSIRLAAVRLSRYSDRVASDVLWGYAFTISY